MNLVNRIYQCTLYTSGLYRIPVRFDGHIVEREVVAKNHSKARYRFWCELKDAWDEDNVRIQDIHVRSLAKSEPIQNYSRGWEQRLNHANQVIRVIGQHGRHFLSENSDRHELISNPFFSYFVTDARNELWFYDYYTRQGILVRHSDWHDFSGGGTLRSLVSHLAGYIQHDLRIMMQLFGPWPADICAGDLWGYGDDMQKVRDEISEILSKEVIA